MKTLFIAAGPIEWGSSRMRCYWPAKYMQDTAVIAWDDYQRGTHQERVEDYDAVIFQKLFDTSRADYLRGQLGIKVWWDICDPAWWWQPEQCKEAANHVDGIVACNKALADDFAVWHEATSRVMLPPHDHLYETSGLPVHVIPDRLELSHFHTQRQHADVSPIRFIWFGIAVNRISLLSAVANVERLVANGHKIELTILDDQPNQPFTISNMFPIYHTRWTLESEVEIIGSHDVALLPPYPGRWGEVKSDNKKLTANACGLPIWDGKDYFHGVNLCKYPHDRCILPIWDEADVRQSAVEWERLLNENYHLASS